MPRIPMSDPAGPLPHQSDSVPAAGAAGAGFGTGDTRAMAALGQGITASTLQLTGAAAGFLRQRRETENTLAAAGARNLYRSINDELDARMAENPAQYDHFREWALEADRKYQDQVRQFTDRMTGDFGKLFAAEMEGIREETTARRTRVGIQARVTADYNLWQEQWKQAATAGNEALCRFLMDRERGRLISETEYQQKLLDFNRLRDAGEARRLVEAGTGGIIGRLEARNEDGGFAEFTSMDADYRDRLIRVARANDAQKRADENQILIDRLASGEQITREQIEAAFQDRVSPEDIKQKNQQRRILEQFLRQQKAAEESARREARREAREEESARREARREAREKESRERREAKDRADAMETRIMNFPFSGNPAQRKLEYNELRQEIYSAFAADEGVTRRLMTQLNETLKARTDPGGSYKHTWLYKTIFAELEDMKKEFTGRGEEKGSPVVVGNYEMMKLKLDEFLRLNPDTTLEDARKFISSTKDLVNEKAAADLMAFWSGYRIEPRKIPPVGHEETGYVFLGGDPSNPENWKAKGDVIGAALQMGQNIVSELTRREKYK